MSRILNIIQNLGLGGASRALLAMARESRLLGGYEHAVISLTPPDPTVLPIAAECGVEVLRGLNHSAQENEIQRADIVQLHWWNVPEMTDWLRQSHAPMRLIHYYHVAGDKAPHFITPELIDHSDLSLACNPYTYEENPALKAARHQGQSAKVGMVYGAADFDRLTGLQPKPHAHFNVGYIGTVEFHKMHPDFIAMSSRIRIPNIRVQVCGNGVLATLKQQAESLQALDRIQILGYVADIRSLLSEMDVYGYPLCEDTYAGSELNLQEAMFAGIPPVVFPHGGIKRLVVHQFTGLVVQTPDEYVAAIEYLYHHPDERKRLGENAKRYSEQLFGATHAGRQMNAHYAQLLARPKRERQPMYGGTQGPQGAKLFLATLADDANDFTQSLQGNFNSEMRQADERISHRAQVVKINGLIPYSQRFPKDPHLHYWSGLMLEAEGQDEPAGLEYLAAQQTGLPHGRALERLERIAKARHLEGLRNWVAVQRQQIPESQPSQPQTSAPIQRNPSSDFAPDALPTRIEPVYPELLKFIDAQAWPKAESLVRLWLESHEDCPRLWNDLGAILYQAGQSKEACVCFEKAIKLAPHYRDPIDNLDAILQRH